MSEEITIREATHADVPRIQSVARETWTHTYEGIIPPGVQDQALATWYSSDSLVGQISGQGNLLSVAEVDGVCIGFAQFFRRSEDVAELARIYILPAHQGKGIGARLLERGSSWLKAAGVRRLTVEVEELNPIARRFYEHQGFQEVERRQEVMFGHQLSTVSYERPVQ